MSRLGPVYEARLLIISKTKYEHGKFGGKFIHFWTEVFLGKYILIIIIIITIIIITVIIIINYNYFFSVTEKTNSPTVPTLPVCVKTHRPVPVS